MYQNARACQRCARTLLGIGQTTRTSDRARLAVTITIKQASTLTNLRPTALHLEALRPICPCHISSKFAASLITTTAVHNGQAQGSGSWVFDKWSAVHNGQAAISPISLACTTAVHNGQASHLTDCSRQFDKWSGTKVLYHFSWQVDL